MRRRAPRSTLFPYTTLFRSTCTIVRRRYFRPLSEPIHRTRATRFSLETQQLELLKGKTTAYIMPLARITKDRKSTRLNSSHANISYAVFCLKKKKHSDQQRQ